MTLYLLLLYLLVFAGTLIICRLVVKRVDRTDTLTPLPVPAAFDPYEMTYLRTGDKRELARLAVLDLVDSGHLSIRRRESWGFGLTGWRSGPERTILEQARERQGLPWYLSTVLSWFTTPQKAEEMYNDDPRLGDLSRLCLEMEERLRKDTLLRGREVESVGMKAWGVSFVVLSALAAPKLPIPLLIFLMLLVLMGTALASNTGHLSKRGKAYLRRLKLEYVGAAASTVSLTSTASHTHSSLLVGFALFGKKRLQGTDYEFIREMFLPDLSKGD
jgi:uncharacterized protein (TIGR04222 family)